MKVPGLKEILKTAFFIEHLWWLLLNIISQFYPEFFKLENRYQLMGTLLPLRVISNRSNWPNIWLRFDSTIKFSIWQTKSFIFRFDIKFLDSWIFKQHHGLGKFVRKQFIRGFSAGILNSALNFQIGKLLPVSRKCYKHRSSFEYENRAHNFSIWLLNSSYYQ